jgi:SAM-dependent methyltransferase
VASELYDKIGRRYSATRRADPRLASAIWGGLGDARTVVNVGAGTGSYEPPDREVVAVEPSAVMIAGRPAGAAPVKRAHAEALPFPDGSFDAAIALLSDHHWHDRARGLSELRRVARQRVVLFNANPGEAELFWLTTEYLPEFLDLIPARFRSMGAWERDLQQALGPLRLVEVPIPHDCTDGFYGAYWRRPEAYLDPHVRAAISVFSLLSRDASGRALEALRDDLATGAWHERHRDLLERSELHLGFYVVIAELG